MRQALIYTILLIVAIFLVRSLAQWDDMDRAKSIIQLQDQNDQKVVEENKNYISTLNDQICELRAKKRYIEKCNESIQDRIGKAQAVTCPEWNGKAKYDTKQDTCLVDTDTNVSIK